MNVARLMLLTPLAIVAYCAWRAGDLATAWRVSTYDNLGWLAFLVWLVPIGLARLVGPRPAEIFPLANRFGTFALLVSLLGTLGSINLLHHFGLALALAALLPGFGIWHWPWLLAAVSWMPAAGWLGKDLSAAQLSMVRLAVPIATGAVLEFGLLRRHTTAGESRP